MGLRISGVVRAARDAHKRLREGVPPEERETFLSSVRDLVRQVEAICSEHGVGPAELPAPSRRAFEDLSALAAMAPGDVPTPVEGTAPAPRIEVRNVVSTLNRVLATLARGEDPGEIVPIARLCVDTVQTLCREAGGTPAALPPRTGEAYAMLRWLLAPGNMGRYIDGREAAARVFTARWEAFRDDPRHPERRCLPDLVPLVRFQPGRRSYALKPRGPYLDCRLGIGCLSGSDEDLRALAEVALGRDEAEAASVKRYHDFVDSEDYGALMHELRVLHRGECYHSRGRVHDLGALFHRVNERFFGGSMSRPHLDWHAGTSRTRFGFYAPSLDLVCVEARLDTEAVPEFVVEFVLYHELLHKKHGNAHRGRRRAVHPAAFRAEERRHPRMAEADRWLGALARGDLRPCDSRTSR